MINHNPRRFTNSYICKNLSSNSCKNGKSTSEITNMTITLGSFGEAPLADHCVQISLKSNQYLNCGIAEEIIELTDHRWMLWYPISHSFGWAKLTGWQSKSNHSIPCLSVYIIDVSIFMKKLKLKVIFWRYQTVNKNEQPWALWISDTWEKSWSTCFLYFGTIVIIIAGF